MTQPGNECFENVSNTLLCPDQLVPYTCQQLGHQHIYTLSGQKLLGILEVTVMVSFVINKENRRNIEKTAALENTVYICINVSSYRVSVLLDPVQR